MITFLKIFHYIVSFFGFNYRSYSKSFAEFQEEDGRESSLAKPTTKMGGVTDVNIDDKHSAELSLPDYQKTNEDTKGSTLPAIVDKYSLKSSSNKNRLAFKLKKSNRWYIYDPQVKHQNPLKTYLFCSKSKSFNEYSLETVSKTAVKLNSSDSKPCFDEYRRFLSKQGEISINKKSSVYGNLPFTTLYLDPISANSPLFEDTEKTISYCSINESLKLMGTEVHSHFGLVAFINPDKIDYDIEEISELRVLDINYGSKGQASYIKVSLIPKRERSLFSCVVKVPQGDTSDTLCGTQSELKRKFKGEYHFLNYVYFAKNPDDKYKAEYIALTSESDLNHGYNYFHKADVLGAIPDEFNEKLNSLKFNLVSCPDKNVYLYPARLDVLYQQGSYLAQISAIKKVKR